MWVLCKNQIFRTIIAISIASIMRPNGEIAHKPKYWAAPSENNEAANAIPNAFITVLKFMVYPFLT